MQEPRGVGHPFPLTLGLSLQQVQASDNIHAPPHSPSVPADLWAQDSWMSASCAIIGKGGMYSSALS